MNDPLPGTSNGLCSPVASGSSISSTTAIARRTFDHTSASSLSDALASYRTSTGGVDGHDVG
jgi:hypothetical protein